MAVVARMFELGGGRMRAATWEQVRAAESRLNTVIPSLLPYDAGFVDRVRAVPWRAQPHVLDEAIFALLQGGAKDGAPPPVEGLKVFFLTWIATEVMDANWMPPNDFVGETSYEFYPVDPPTPEQESPTP